MKKLKILILLVFAYGLKAQDVGLNVLWEESTGLRSGDYGLKGIVSPDRFYYEMGVDQSASGLKHLKVIKSFEGEVIWSLTLDSSFFYDYIPTALTWSDYGLIGAAYQPILGSGRNLVFSVSETGAKNWMEDSLMDLILTDVKVDEANSQILFAGSMGTQLGGRDAFIEARQQNGQILWSKSFDQYGYKDVALELAIDGNQYILLGSSEAGLNQWEMASWYLRADGTPLGYESGSRFTNSIDELSDGHLTANGLIVVGQSAVNSQRDFKIYAFDFNRSLLWMDSYDRQGLDDYALAFEETSSGNYIVTGASASVTTNSDALIRAYNGNGNILWTTILDFKAGKDEAIAVAEDVKGNLLVLCNTESSGQRDVYLICLNQSTGGEKWRTRVSNSLLKNDIASGLHLNSNGEIWITYQEEEVNNLSVLNYADLNFPQDFEPISRSNMFIENRGHLRDTKNEAIPEIKYYSQGHSVPYYFKNAGFIALQGGHGRNTPGGDTLQRVDFNFLASKSSQLAALESYHKETYFNIYDDLTPYEGCETFGALVYPNLYENIDVYMHSNSEGFKMSYHLKPGAKLEDIQLQILGANGLNLQNGNLVVQTIENDLEYLAPYSYQEGGSSQNDGCLEYELQGNVLRFKTSNCEISYPYVIHIRAGVGNIHSYAAINNMDWSTFYGGTWEEGGNDMAVDASNGDVFIAGYAYSSNLPSTPGIGFIPSRNLRGLVLKFDRDAELKWGLLLGAVSGPSASVANLSFKGIALEDNLNVPGVEIHAVGEYSGILSPLFTVPNIPSGSFQQQSPLINGANGNPGGINRDLVLVTLNATRTRIFTSPYGGNGIERVYTAQVRNGHFYFAGSTDNGSSANASSSLPPATHVFPVYNPQDGSFFRAVHPSPGNERAFVAALNLSTYQLSYSSIITKSSNSNSDYTAIYNLRGEYYVGKSLNGARLGFFDNGRMFSGALNYNNTQDPNRSYYSDVVPAMSPNGDFDLYYFGFDGNGSNPLASSSLNGSYQSTVGEAYLFKRREASVAWDTYFGPQAGQNPTWNFSGGLWAFDFEIPSSKGKMVYSNRSATLFVGASSIGNTPSQSFPNYFFEAGNNSGSGNRSDIYLAAFSSNSTNRSDYFNWGTMYGEACLNCSGGFSSGFGEDYLSDLDLYFDGTEEYLYVLGTSMSISGTLSSNVDLFPVADLGLANSYFQQNSGGSYDIVLSRFKVGDISNGLEVEEHVQKNELFSVYPQSNSRGFHLGIG